MVAILAGCGDPASSRIPVGAKGFIVAHDQKYDRVYLMKSSDGLMPGLPLGTHLLIVDDTADPEHDWATRDVRIHVEDGEHAGKSGVVTRWNIHPE